MPLGSPSLTARTSWKNLQNHAAKIRDVHLRELFAADSKRGERFAIEALGLYFDYSKNRITDESIVLLLKLAEETGLKAKIDAMFRGDRINLTEDRSVLHVALRAPKGGLHSGRGRKYRPACSRCAGQDGRLHESSSQRRMAGSHGQANSKHRQHRHWRLRSRPGHGL